MILIILVCVLAVALVVETLYFNIKQVRKINKNILVRDEFIDHLFNRVKKNECVLESVKDKGEDLQDMLFEEVIPRVNALIDLAEKKPTKAKTKPMKKAVKKAGRSKKK